MKKSQRLSYMVSLIFVLIMAVTASTILYNLYPIVAQQEEEEQQKQQQQQQPLSLNDIFDKADNSVVQITRSIPPPTNIQITIGQRPSAIPYLTEAPQPSP
jgi:Na+-transporting NADH:ubiquinone oxidoreductase subunit NqrC